MKYGIVGEDSQIPSRLEELYKTYSTNMLISKSTFERLPAGAFFTRPIDVLHLRHTSKEAEMVYEVLRNQRCGSKVAEALELHADAMDFYLAREFAAAAELFEKVGQIILQAKGKDDPPSELLLAR